VRPIRLLPPELVREIAAGEVIARPADAVKELLENALDAHATRIEIELEAGGIVLLRVTDDGDGVPRDQLELAPQRFATSKLESLSSISSFGFRGEALWSIAVAAELSITSRPAIQLGGACLTAHFRGDGTDQVQVADVPCAAGTSVVARDLFADFPARKASLESAALEARRVGSLVSRYVLHHPGLAWRLVVDGEVRLQHAPGSHRDAMATVYGALASNRMLEVGVQDGAYSVRGVTSRPELARPRRDRLHIAVNGRPVELEDSIASTVQRAYSSLLPKGHSPVAALEIVAPPTALNVNTHPGKLRVAFLEPARVEAVLTEAIAGALREHPLVRAAPEPRVVTGPIRAASSFPPLEFIGAYRDAYLLAEGDGDLWLIDQHAAHERILYEELEAAFIMGQSLELPEAEFVTLSPAEIAMLEVRDPELRAMGLILEPFGGGLHRVRAVPAVIAGLPLEEGVRQIVHDALGLEEARRAVLSRLACHPAVKAGHRFAHADAQELLEALRECQIPWACPHGRPTALRLTERDLAHQFGRRSPRDVARAGDEISRER
jgi:DNA mismatch repair protein MutL